jgi:hypothetical protein
MTFKHTLVREYEVEVEGVYEPAERESRNGYGQLECPADGACFLIEKVTLDGKPFEITPKEEEELASEGFWLSHH